MRQVTGIPVLFLGLAALGWAQEDASSTSRFFRGKRVAFWGVAKEESPKSVLPPGGAETIWAEPIRMPDGRMTVYLPPKPVLAFLDAPSEESGRAYLAWQKARMEKIAQASEILGRLVQEGKSQEMKGALPAQPLDSPSPAGPPPGKPMPAEVPKAAPPLPAGAPEILYFKKAGCPACLREDATLAELVRERPNLKVRVFTPGQEEALWDALEIKAVPTLVIRGGDGRLHVARGYTPKEVLLEKLGPSPGGAK